MSGCCQSVSPAGASSYLSPSLNAGGALDVIVILQPDGSLRSTGWYVIFDSLGPWGLPNGITNVRIEINGQHFDCLPKLQVRAVQEPAAFAEERAGGSSGSSSSGSGGRSQTSMAAEASAATVPPRAVLDALASSGLLQEGRNELRYCIGGEWPHCLCVRSFLYLWRSVVPAVIFDIDGTISLNDLAGQAAMLFDASPTHPGVCELLCQLHARGYAVMYLTSRPLLGPSGIERTRRFLFEVCVDQPSGFRMPPAAVLTTTHAASLAALTAELTGQSKAFKSLALKVVRDAFGHSLAGGGESSSSSSGSAGSLGSSGGSACSGTGGLGGPSDGGSRFSGGLYAGFGNREKDALAYLSAGVPPERIFLIDPSSVLVGRASTALAPSSPGGALASGVSPPSLPSSRRMPQQPKWRSYAELLEVSLDDIFPKRCAEPTFEATLHQLSPLTGASSGYPSAATGTSVAAGSAVAATSGSTTPPVAGEIEMV